MQQQWHVRVKAELVSASPYSGSKPPGIDKDPGESFEAFEQRIWQHRSYYAPDDRILICGHAIKCAMIDACKFLGTRIPGRGTATWTNQFLKGIHPVPPPGQTMPHLYTDKTRADFLCEPVYCHSNGVKAPGPRVIRLYPLLPEWKGEIHFIVLNPSITESLFLRHLNVAGTFCGVGRFRVGVGGSFGRWLVQSLKWEEVGDRSTAVFVEEEAAVVTQPKTRKKIAS